VAGVARSVIGILFLLFGLLLLLTIIGFLVGIFFIIVGVVLLASGFSAREDAERMRQQQAQTNALLQQQMQLTAMQANRAAGAASYPPTPQYGTPAPSAPSAEKYCPSCGAGNTRVAAFCQRCGKPLPPPS
jgi:uncharacterized paraquat-inducible protein A